MKLVSFLMFKSKDVLLCFLPMQQSSCKNKDRFYGLPCFLFIFFVAFFFCILLLVLLAYLLLAEVPILLYNEINFRLWFSVVSHQSQIVQNCFCFVFNFSKSLSFLHVSTSFKASTLLVYSLCFPLFLFIEFPLNLLISSLSQHANQPFFILCIHSWVVNVSHGVHLGGNLIFWPHRRHGR